MGRKLRPSNQTRYDVFYVFFFTNYLSLFEISLSLFEINKFEMIGLNGYVLKKFHEKSLLSLSLSLQYGKMTICTTLLQDIVHDEENTNDGAVCECGQEYGGICDVKRTHTF